MNKYSVLYSPDIMLAVTITGQLALAMLIESLEEVGAEVVSAYTDGLVILINDDGAARASNELRKWRHLTKMKLDIEFWKGLYAQSVNSYFAVKTDGTTKGKGLFNTDRPLQVNPAGDIIAKSVVDFVANGVNIEDTIELEPRIESFLFSRSVKGMGEWNGKTLGKVVRWYYSKSPNAGPITYLTNGNKVPKSDNCRPLMTLPDELPKDIDYDRYCSEAYDLLTLVGYI